MSSVVYNRLPLKFVLWSISLSDDVLLNSVSFILHYIIYLNLPCYLQLDKFSSVEDLKLAVDKLIQISDTNSNQQDGEYYCYHMFKNAVNNPNLHLGKL